jgi:hypothetical protein
LLLARTKFVFEVQVLVPEMFALQDVVPTYNPGARSGTKSVIYLFPIWTLMLSCSGAGGGGDGKGPAAGISSTGYHSTMLERMRAASPSRDRPNMLGCTRPGMALVCLIAGQ